MPPPLPGHVPAGTVLAYGGEDRFDIQTPDWTACNGASLNRFKYPDLFKVIGYSNGKDANDDFKLPDLRGMFMRGKLSLTPY